ncbi:hypothetical protein K469DRAFT_204685 [Zopfia rhizophila CBS 207.26]|uniref:Uncharacterized protein n=1 Tax=Zopfia rhizophila CBS 207.26 TaxID=1314779 RepID=A0A6A6E0K0_9PEZI|nr:hypothetical protein K469DRAFT_204685 [Zopfia rhizophila CBS 207.26]
MAPLTANLFLSLSLRHLLNFPRLILPPPSKHHRSMVSPKNAFAGQLFGSRQSVADNQSFPRPRVPTVNPLAALTPHPKPPPPVLIPFGLTAGFGFLSIAYTELHPSSQF